MTEDEFRELLELVRNRLASLGLGDLTDDDLYRVSPERDELVRPDKQLIEMLGRTLEVLNEFDGATVDRALNRIADVSTGAPSDVELILPTDRGPRRIELSRELPRLDGVRQQLETLIARLAEARPER